MARIISCLGVGAVNASFKPHPNLIEDDLNKALTMTGNNEVGLGRHGDPVVGRLAYLNWGEQPEACTVQIAGVMQLPYKGDSMEVRAQVVVDGKGNLLACHHVPQARGIVLNVMEDSTVYLNL